MKIQLKKGTLEMCVLASYAYDIVSQLEGGLDMSEGTIYPLMRRLQAEGWVTTYLVESESGPPRKYYKLTATAHEELVRMRRDWHEFTTEVNKILGATL